MKIYDGRHDKQAQKSNRTVTVVSSGRISSTTDSMTIRKHGREDWSMFFCESGCIHFGDTVIKSGEVWIYPPNVAQKYTVYCKDQTVYRYIHFTGSDVGNLLSQLKIDVNVAISVKNPTVTNIFESISDAVKENSALSDLTAEYQTLRLISKIAQGRKFSSERFMLNQVLDEMEHSFSKQYDAGEYARMLNISVDRFNHIFKDYIGISPYAYYLKLRMENACSLLEETDLKVKDIAEKCGYNEALYFTQAFKKHTGQTPSKFRRQNKK